MPGDPVDQLTVRFRGLEITVSVPGLEDQGAGSADSGFEIVPGSRPPSGPATASSVGGSDHEWIVISAALEEQTVSATSAEALLQLDLDSLNHLCARLRAHHPIWTPRARIARAFRAGLLSRQRLDTAIIPGETPAIPFRNSVYIVLWCERFPQGFWTEDYSEYIAEVRRGAPTGHRFHPRSISHSFPSVAEGEAFLVGARRRWPLRR